MLRRLIIVCLCLGVLPLLTACGGDDAPAAASVIPVSHRITDQQAGPITPGTAYSAAALRQLFPNERVDVIATADEDGVVNALTVFDDGLQVMMAIPASGGRTIKAVHGSGLAVAGPNGERLGMTFRQIGVDRSACRVGTNAWAGMAVCQSRGTRNVFLVFDNGGWNGPPNELAPASTLAQGQLQRIVWVPPAGG